VLGAGVSLSRGVPTWSVLARSLAKRLETPIPADAEVLHPLGLPIAFERMEASCAKRGAVFAEELRAQMYGELGPQSDTDTLGVLAALLVREQALDVPRIRRVVTFNVDDLLETEANGERDPFVDPVLWAITRESARPRAERGAGGRPPIPVYHLHGFLPRPGTELVRRDAIETLVFTEAQYWATFAEPQSFPNRVMMNALHDSVCVFLGLSMTDVNLARWLGLRALTISRDLEGTRASPDPLGRTVRDALDHHFWIRRRPDPRSSEAFVTPLLRDRGVRTIDLDAWGALGGVLRAVF
jgi:SIR2-like domain